MDLLSDDEFGHFKKKKMALEISQLEIETANKEENSQLEKELLRARISELRAREEFFREMTKVVKLNPSKLFTFLTEP